MITNHAATAAATAATNAATRTASKHAAFAFAVLALALSFPVAYTASRPDAVPAFVLAAVALVAVPVAAAVAALRSAVRSRAYAAALAEARLADREAALRAAESRAALACDALKDERRRAAEAAHRATAEITVTKCSLDYLRHGEGAALAFAARLARCTPGALVAFADARAHEAGQLASGTGGGSLSPAEAASLAADRMRALASVIMQAFPEYTREGARTLADAGTAGAPWPLDAE